MYYDKSSHTYRVPVKANPTCFEAGEVQFDAANFHAVVKQVLEGMLSDRKAEQAEADAAVIDAAVHAQVPLLANLVARRLTSATSGRTALREVVAAAVADELQQRMPQIAQAVMDTPAPQVDEQLGRYEIRVQGETRRLLEEEFASPVAPQSRLSLVENAVLIGLQAMRNMHTRQCPTPKVARADIPAEYEYDPSTDSYVRHGVSVDVFAGADFLTYVEPHGLRVLRNKTPLKLDIAVKAKAR